VGSLYEGVDEPSLSQRRVAIKVLHGDLTLTEIDVQRFKREARCAMQLNHPHVVQVLEFLASVGEPPCIVMEHLHGQTLHELLKTSGRITPHRAVRVALQVLSALDAAHHRGIVHRDIKPENIFLTLQASQQDLIKVVDFGSAKLLGEATGVPLTVTGMVVGTLSFMPPEQALAKRVDHRADLYALAATLYAAISGQQPFVATSPAEILEAVQHAEPRSLRSFGVDGVDTMLDAIVRKGLQKEAAARYQSAVEMERALQRWLDLAPPETERWVWRTIPLRSERWSTVPPPPREGDTAHHTLEGVSVDAPVAYTASSVQRAVSLADLVMPRIGHMFGRYRILALLGAGGVSEVFRAEDTELQRPVAVKVLRVAGASGAGVTTAAAERMLKEARIAATIDHPNAIAIFDVDTREGLPYLVMELVEGRSFRDLVRDPLISVERKVHWLVEIARALSAAHKKGIVHRDIKPENVMLRELDQAVKVLDFGIAQRMFEKNVIEHAEVNERIPGTPAYMAPEQMYGQEATDLSDQFAWGVFAYELLSGTLPWMQRGGMLHLVHQVLTRTPEPPSRRRPEVPAQVEAAVMRAMAKKPEERYPSMDAAISALVEAWVASLVTKPEPTDEVTVKKGAPWRTPPWRGRTVTAAVAAATIIVGGTAVRESRAPRTQANTAADTVDPSGTTLSRNPEALASYRAGLLAVYDAAGGAARRHLERATTLDPGFAAAHLRKVLATPWVGDAERADVLKATQLRDALGEHDRALLNAIEPWVGVPQDAAEAERRLSALDAAHPHDVDTLYQLCRFRFLAGHYARAIDACRAAETIDPQFAGAFWLEGQSLLFAGDTPAGTRSLEACLRLSPAATSCLNDFFQLESHGGACSAAFGHAQRLVELEPENSRWRSQLGSASHATGKPLALVRAAYEQSSEWSSAVPIQRARARANLAILTGDFGEALAQLDAWERALEGNKEEDAHADLLKMRALFRREAGPDAALPARANSFLASRAAWSPNPEGDRSIDALVALYREGTLSRAAFVAARSEWLAHPPPVGRYGMTPGTRWVTAYADAVVTPEDAREAIAALPAHHALPPDRVRMPYEDEAIGRMYLVAGRVDDALPFLRRAAASCEASEFPLQHTWATFELGQALESSDVPAACAAYQVVLDRWAVAARSHTAYRAHERRLALGCR